MAEHTKTPHIIIVGAGPGGLTAGMLLAHRGARVTLLEQKSRVGGRNAELTLGDYRFDIGPTFLMMRFLLEQIFEETGRNASEYMEIVDLDPMYELRFKDGSIFPSSNTEKMRAEVARTFPGEEEGFDAFLKREAKRFHYMYPCLQKDYSSPTALLSKPFLRSIPHLGIGKSLYQVLSNYFSSENLKLSFTFQSKYLGMSPWTCPGAFAMIPYVEYGYGIHHVMGGLSKISEGMAKVVIEEGGDIQLNTKVDRIVTRNGKACGVTLEDGRTLEADDVIINADFAHAMSNLFEPGYLKKYPEEKLKHREYSCSTFMLYLGLDKVYDIPHHLIVFAEDYRKNLTDISQRKVLSDEFSFYVRNASVNDPSLAPEGHSALYVLVPVPNNQSGIDWEAQRETMREQVLQALETRGGLTDLRKHIRAEEVISPDQWESDYNVFLGATFNLAHTLEQMLYFRPHNRFEEAKNCYLVGGGTHPGSGLPTIYESGRITSNLISDKYRLRYKLPPTVPPKRGNIL